MSAGRGKGNRRSAAFRGFTVAHPRDGGQWFLYGIGSPPGVPGPLILLKQAASISLAGTGNIGIACAQPDTLEMELGAGVVSRPTGCL